MKKKQVLQCISGCLSVALVFQAGTSSVAYASERSDVIQHSESSEEVQSVENVEDVQNVETSEAVQGVETPEDVQEVETPEAVQGVETPEDVQGVETPEDVQGVETPEDVQGVETPEDVQGVETPEEVQGVETPEEVQNVENIEEEQSLETMRTTPENQEKWDKLKQELGKNGNPVTTYINKFDGKEKTIIWAKGIKPPTIGNDESYQLHPVVDSGYIIYKTEYIEDHGWYDLNKKGGADFNLCFAVAATNSLHWWMDQNDAKIQKYIAENPDDVKRKKLDGFRHSFHNLEKSDIFEYFLKTFGNRPYGYWPDLLHDHFVNGYPYKTGSSPSVNQPPLDKPNTEDLDSGFVYDIFGENLLTQRLEAGSYDNASEQIKKAMMDGKIVMPTYEFGRGSHVVTMWGAEYDLDGKISAVFLSDSDDGGQPDQAMIRYGVKRAYNGRAMLTNKADGTGGSPLWLLHTLSLGETYWDEYFSHTGKHLDITWGNTEFTYDGEPHKPEITFSGVAQGHDVNVVSTGEKIDAGEHQATAQMTGKDAQEYSIPSGKKTQTFVIHKAKAHIDVTADLNEYATNKVVKLRADVSGVKNEKPDGKIIFWDQKNIEIGRANTRNGVAEICWEKPKSGAYQIKAQFMPYSSDTAKNYMESASQFIDIDLNKKNQQPLVFAPMQDKRFGDSDFALNVTGGSGTGDVVYSSSRPDVISINGKTASIKGVGTTEITATKKADHEYNSQSVTITVTVAKGIAPDITYPTASNLTYGQTLSESTLTGGSTNLGSFAWAEPALVPNAGNIKQRVTFTPNAFAEQNYEPITKLSHEIDVTVNQAKPTVTLNAQLQKDQVILTAEIQKVGQGNIPENGTVKFIDCTDNTNVTIAAVEVQNGVATYTWKDVPQKRYQIKAEYSGNQNYTQAMSENKTIDTIIYPEGTHPITIQNDGNGTAQASHTIASKDTKVTLTATPNSGFQFKEWKVLEGEVNISNNTFMMPDMPVSIQAIFEKKNDTSGGGSSGGSGGGGGGGGGSTKPDTTENKKNPDGSTTEITHHPDESVVSTTKKPDGSVVVEVTMKDGTTSKTETSAEGKEEVQVKIPESVSAKAEQTNTSVSLPMKPVSTQNGTDHIIHVNVDQGNQVQISVPVEQPNSGAVAVIIHADGTKQVVRKSVVTDQGVILTVKGDATFTIEDHSKQFVDTQGHWAENAINFVSSHEIYSGTGENKFSPDAQLTRSMLVKTLYNLENNPKVEKKDQFSDVKSDDWFADSVQWAVEQGVVSGIGNGQFDPNRKITREEIAVILYRYAGSPATGESTLNFHDADQISAYANTAIQWAVDNGILKGTTNNNLDPKGTATRAQAASMMMRFLHTVMK